MKAYQFWALLILLSFSSCLVQRDLTQEENFYPFNEIGSSNMNFIYTVSYLRENGIDEQTSIHQENQDLHIEPWLDREISSYVDYFDDLGRSIQRVSIRASPSGNDIVVPVLYDLLGKEELSFLPFVPDSRLGSFIEDQYTKQIEFYLPRSADSIPVNYATSRFPYARTVYERSPLLRIVEQGAPGEAWQPSSSSVLPISGHTVKIDRRANLAADKVLRWEYEENEPGGMILKITSEIEFLDAQLSVNETTDENGGVILTFADKQGQELLKRVINRKNGFLLDTSDTYFVYDEKGNLKLVIPPEAIAQNNFPGELPLETRMQFLTEYYYDGLGRLIRKRLPGTRPSPEAGIEYVYDKLNRPVLTRDLNLREKNQWQFTKFDKYGRPIITGIFTTRYQEPPLVEFIAEAKQDYDYSRDKQQEFINEQIVAKKVFLYEKRRTGTDLDSNLDTYYSNYAYPPHEDSKILTVTYYDDYDFDNDGKPDFFFEDDPLISEKHSDWQPFYRVKNRVTKQKVRVLPNEDSPREIRNLKSFEQPPVWIKTVNFFDHQGRIIQSQTDRGILSNNRYAPPVYTSVKDIKNIVFDFSGKILEAKRIHIKPRYQVTPSVVIKDTIVVQERYTYDNDGRLVDLFHKINEEEEILVSRNSYSVLGQHIETNLHSEGDYSYFLQSIDYRRNIRGWLDGINPGPYHLTYTPDDLERNPFETNNKNASNDIFSMVLSYGDSPQESRNSLRLESAFKPSFNGNISSASFQTAVPRRNPVIDTDPIFDPYPIDYQYNPIVSQYFNYDGKDQLISSKFFSYRFQYRSSEIIDFEPLGGFASDYYATNYTYDKNGNFQSAFRTGEVKSGGTNLFSTIDDLLYIYNGNRLCKVFDRANFSTDLDFKNAPRLTLRELVQQCCMNYSGEMHNYLYCSDLGSHYKYDWNGNLVYDRNKNITRISYNHLNLPYWINFKGNKGLEFTFDALGEILQKSTHEDWPINLHSPVRAPSQKVAEYFNGYVYEDGELKYFDMPQGRVTVKNDGTFRYEYFIKDHLGNVRISFTKEELGGTRVVRGKSFVPSRPRRVIERKRNPPYFPKLLQENHYYPFGLRIVGLSRETVLAGENKNNTTYNSQTLYSDFGLEWLHFGARFLDPQLGRWHNVDPEEQYASGYLSLGNNPIRNIDIDGAYGLPRDLIDGLKDFNDAVNRVKESFEAYRTVSRRGRIVSSNKTLLAWDVLADDLINRMNYWENLNREDWYNLAGLSMGFNSRGQYNRAVEFFDAHINALESLGSQANVGSSPGWLLFLEKMSLNDGFSAGDFSPSLGQIEIMHARDIERKFRGVTSRSHQLRSKLISLKKDFLDDE